MGHVSREKALQAQRNADLLLLLESSNEESRGVLTGKIFEYIASGRPIICIGSRLDFEIGQTLFKTGSGISAIVPVILKLCILPNKAPSISVWPILIHGHQGEVLMNPA